MAMGMFRKFKNIQYDEMTENKVKLQFTHYKRLNELNCHRILQEIELKQKEQTKEIRFSNKKNDSTTLDYFKQIEQTNG